MHYANINKLLSLECKTALRAHFAIFLPNRCTSCALFLQKIGWDPEFKIKRASSI